MATGTLAVRRIDGTSGKDILRDLWRTVLIFYLGFAAAEIEAAIAVLLRAFEGGKLLRLPTPLAAR